MFKMVKMEKRGKLVVVEGSDCSGKTTQINLLLERLKQEGIDFEIFDFPDYGTPTGKIVSMYLSNKFGPANELDPKIASLFYAHDRFSQKHRIENALKEGKFVILDRYVESNMGHQGGKIASREEREQFFKWLEELEYGNFSIPKPDAVLFFYMPFEVGNILKQRRDTEKGVQGNIKHDGHEDNLEHQKNAETAYLHLAEFYDWIKIDCAPDGTLVSLRKPENIAEQVWAKIMEI